MEIDEVVTRLTKRYWMVLLVAVVVPIVLVGVMVSRQQATYTAHARVAVSAEVPKSAAEASSLVSQVHALATSRDLIATALAGGGVTNRDPQTIADHDVSVSGQGTSAIVDIGVKDRSAAVAAAIAQHLATGVTSAFDRSRIGNLPSVIAGVDQQLDQLARRRAPIASSLASVSAANPHDPSLRMLQSQLAGLDTLISDLSADRARLAEELAGSGHAIVVDKAQVPAHADPRGLVEKMTLAGLAGLIAGLILVAAIETIRPTVSGAARLARLLSAPLLGRLDRDPAALQALGQRVRLAARQGSVNQLVVTSANGRAVPEWVLDRLRGAVLDPLRGVVARPADVTANEVKDAALVGARSQYGTRANYAARDHNAPTPAVELNGRRRPDAEIRGISSIGDLTPAGETERIGVIVLAGGSFKAASIHDIRDLVDASGWPLLGVASYAKRG